MDKSLRQDNPTSFKNKGKDKKDETSKKYFFFLCNGPCQVLECPKYGKLVALGMEKEKCIASISILGAIQSKVREQASGCMYLETEARGKKLQTTWTQDTGADTMYMVRELADEINLS